MTTICVGFNDFKKLINNERIYYYIGDTFYDFHILLDGLIIKTSVFNKDINNKKQFFSDSIFYGATEILFKLPSTSSNSFYNLDFKKRKNTELIGSKESKKTDIQREGVGKQTDKVIED